MELSLDPQRRERNPLTGQYLKGNTPHNKGRKWSEYMPEESKKKVLSILVHVGNPNLPGCNRRAVVAVKGDKFFVFPSSAEAGRRLSDKNHETYGRNVCACANKKRKHCGGFEWYYEDDEEWMKVIEARQNSNSL